MIKAISQWAIKDAKTSEEAIAIAKQAGFDGIELCIGTSGAFTIEVTREDCKRYRAEADKLGLTLESIASGMSWSCSPTDNDPAVREKAIEQNKRALERVAWLGCTGYLFVPGAIMIPWNKNYKPVRYDYALEWARTAVEELGKTAADLGVDLCLENVWNGFFYSPVEFAQFTDSFDNPNVRIYFDVGNIINHQQYPPHWIEILGNRIHRIHFKDFKCGTGPGTGFCPLMQGDVPWKETMDAIRAIGYDSTLVAEISAMDVNGLAEAAKVMGQIVEL